MIIVVLVMIFVFVMLVLMSLVGRRLELFSSSSLAQLSFPVRWMLYPVVGFVWTLAKIRFPGVETIVTYSFDNKVGYALRAAYWKCRVQELGKDVKIEIGAKGIGWNFISIGDNSWIDRNVIFECGELDRTKYKVYVRKATSEIKAGELRIGKRCHIAKNVVIQAIGGVMIGDCTGIASGAKIYSLSNHYRSEDKNDSTLYKFSSVSPYAEQYLIEGAVVLEGNNALGLNSVILPGVTVGKNSWIGVCSYVVDDIPADSLAVGCPARVIKVFHTR